MKMIVTSVQSQQSPVNALNYILAKEALRSVSGRVPGYISKDAGNDAISLMAAAHREVAGVRHVILSCDKKCDKELAFEALELCASCFVDFFAPGAAFVAALHQNAEHPHAHVVFPNSDGLRAWHWKKKDMSRMQDLGWIPCVLREKYGLIPGKGNGIGRGRVNHSVRKFAADLEALFEENPVEQGLLSGLLSVLPDAAKDGGRLLTFRNCRVPESVLRKQVDYVRLERCTNELSHSASQLENEAITLRNLEEFERASMDIEPD